MLIEINEKNIDNRLIIQATNILKKGGLIIIPTDTVYAIACDLNSKKGLNRWFKEKWKNTRDEIGYKYKNDIYRPTKRITKATPITYEELSAKDIKKARRTKYKKRSK